MPSQHLDLSSVRPSDVFIATISGKQPMPNYVASLQSTRDLLARKGLSVDYLLHSGHCHVDDARNACVREFLESNSKKMVFIDDDVGWIADEFLELIQFDRDVYGAAYPKKGDVNIPDFPVMPFSGTELNAEKDGLVPVRGLPAGMLVISQAAALRMWDTSVKYFFKTDEDDTKASMVFERAVVNGKRWSGDYYFCRKWGELGEQVFVWPEMNLTHSGTYTWQGCLGDFWRKKHDVFDPHMDAAFKMLREGGEINPMLYTAIAARSNNYPWCAPEKMMSVCQTIAAEDGETILEVGSGLTTIMMGMAALKTSTKIHTLEHDLEWFIKTRDMVKRYALPSVNLYYAPLREQPDGSIWHEIPPELPDKFTAVIVDGPPRNISDRKNLWKILGGAIVEADTWVVDDISNYGTDWFDGYEDERDTTIIDRFAVMRRKSAMEPVAEEERLSAA